VAKALHVLQVGHTFPTTRARLGDFDQWTLTALSDGSSPLGVAVRVWDLADGADLPDPADCAGVVITGSHAMVTDELPWSVAVERWLPRVVDAGTPVFGICYGHQLLARALGGQVGYRAQGREIGTVEVTLDAAATVDPLFAGLPATISAHTTHAQSVMALPAGAVRLALNVADPNHAFRFGDTAWGVQFHPEFSVDVMRAYIVEQAVDLGDAGMDVHALVAGVHETPLAARVLHRFVKLAVAAG
jgi:GMP synthase (glutamine-hydrolysing)